MGSERHAEHRYREIPVMSHKIEEFCRGWLPPDLGRRDTDSYSFVLPQQVFYQLGRLRRPYAGATARINQGIRAVSFRLVTDICSKKPCRCEKNHHENTKDESTKQVISFVFSSFVLS